MDFEQLLICKIVEEGEIAQVSDYGITDDYFLSATNRRVFQALRDYKAEYGKIPQPSRIRMDFPNYEFEQVFEPWEDVLDQVAARYHNAVLSDFLADAVEILDDADHRKVRKAVEKVRQGMHETLREVEAAAPNLKDVNLAEEPMQRWERYLELKDRKDELLGIPSGFARIDKALQGFQAGQLIVFVGPPKAGKSTMMLLAAMAAHRLHKVPLLIGFEMSNEEQTQRIDAITAGVSHHRLRGGHLTPDEEKKLRRSLRSWEDVADFFLSNDTMSTTTLTGVEGKVDKYDPAMLIVDGVYMMQDENGEKPGSPQALTNITRGFKRMGQNKDIPIIITTQVLEWKMDKKHGITASSVGYSSSFGQDADALIGVENTDDPMTKKIKIVFARNHPPCEFYVRWDWETGEFTEMPEGWEPDGGYGEGDDEEFGTGGF